MPVGNIYSNKWTNIFGMATVWRGQWHSMVITDDDEQYNLNIKNYLFLFAKYIKYTHNDDSVLLKQKTRNNHIFIAINYNAIVLILHCLQNGDHAFY